MPDIFINRFGRMLKIGIDRAPVNSMSRAFSREVQAALEQLQSDGACHGWQCSAAMHRRRTRPPFSRRTSATCSTRRRQTGSARHRATSNSMSGPSRVSEATSTALPTHRRGRRSYGGDSHASPTSLKEPVSQRRQTLVGNCKSDRTLTRHPPPIALNAGDLRAPSRSICRLTKTAVARSKIDCGICSCWIEWSMSSANLALGFTDVSGPIRKSEDPPGRRERTAVLLALGVTVAAGFLAYVCPPPINATDILEGSVSENILLAIALFH